jgi:hypothetical protein
MPESARSIDRPVVPPPSATRAEQSPSAGPTAGERARAGAPGSAPRRSRRRGRCDGPCRRIRPERKHDKLEGEECQPPGRDVQTVLAPSDPFPRDDGEPSYSRSSLPGATAHQGIGTTAVLDRPFHRYSPTEVELDGTERTLNYGEFGSDPDLGGSEVNLTNPEWPADRPVSVLAYGDDPSELDALLDAIALELSDDPWRIDVVRRHRMPAPPSGASGIRRTEYEPDELLPDQGLRNLARWVAGRPSAPAVWLREVEELSWLPPAVALFLREARRSARRPTLVVAGGERLVPCLPRGVQDAALLLAILARQGVSLVVGTNSSPLPEFAEQFEVVIRAGAGRHRSIVARALPRREVTVAPRLSPVLERSPADIHPRLVQGPPRRRNFGSVCRLAAV